MVKGKNIEYDFFLKDLRANLNKQQILLIKIWP